MANEIEANLHRIDTPSASLVTTANVVIMTVRWVSPLADAGDQAIIQDSGSNIIWESVADAPNYVEKDIIKILAPGGYKVTVLGSGALYIRIHRVLWEEELSYGLRRETAFP